MWWVPYSIGLGDSYYMQSWEVVNLSSANYIAALYTFVGIDHHDPKYRKCTKAGAREGTNYHVLREKSSQESRPTSILVHVH